MGVYQYKRLNLGINTASVIFQKTIEHVLSNLEVVANFSDDIIVFGSTKEEHDRRLEAVLSRLNDSGLTVNESKCEFGKKSLTFFGLQFSENGISIE
jgi:type IV secretory pathway VirB4 component